MNHLLVSLLSGYFIARSVMMNMTLITQQSYTVKTGLGALMTALVCWFLSGSFPGLFIPFAVAATYLLTRGIVYLLAPSISSLSCIITELLLNVVLLSCLSIYYPIQSELLLMSGKMNPMFSLVINFWTAHLSLNFLKISVIFAGFLTTVFVTGEILTAYLQQLHFRKRIELKDGGKKIGQLERALIFIFIFAGQPGGIGFLVAAKSVFRIGELRDTRQRRQAEYIIIGTLASFTAAMITGYLIKYVFMSLK